MWAVLLCSKIEGCGAKAEFENLSVKLKSQEVKLKDFCYKTDRKVDRFRVQVNGFDKSVSQKAVWAEKKSVEKVSESGISSKVNSANSENSVDLKYMLSREYHDKFKGITGDYKIDEQIYKQSQAMLIHRSKTDKEDMCLIDSRTGKIAGRQTHSKPDFYVEYNDSLNNAIKNTGLSSKVCKFIFKGKNNQSQVFVFKNPCL